MIRNYTAPEVFTAALAGESWADPRTDPTRIDWTARQAAALIPFKVVDGRPVNPGERTPVRYGRNELGHWGEQRCADAIVTLSDMYGHRWLLMIERKDGHGWALPGGYVDQGESPLAAAIRELREETGLSPYGGHRWEEMRPRYVPDPRASDEAWMVTVPVQFVLGPSRPAVEGRDDARRAVWVPADSYAKVTAYLANVFDGHVFTAHVDLLRELLG
jgi:ADP-ribose pyrophosphatase